MSSSRVQSVVAGNAEAAAHTASTVRKQREMEDASAQLTVSIPCGPESTSLRHVYHNLFVRSADGHLHQLHFYCSTGMKSDAVNMGVQCLFSVLTSFPWYDQ